MGVLVRWTKPIEGGHGYGMTINSEPPIELGGVLLNILDEE